MCSMKMWPAALAILTVSFASSSAMAATYYRKVVLDFEVGSGVASANTWTTDEFTLYQFGKNFAQPAINIVDGRLVVPADTYLTIIPNSSQLASILAAFDFSGKDALYPVVFGHNYGPIANTGDDSFKHVSLPLPAPESLALWRGGWAFIQVPYNYVTNPPPTFGFAIDNIEFAISNVPEPQTWATMLCGFLAVGALLRRTHRLAAKAGAGA